MEAPNHLVAATLDDLHDIVTLVSSAGLPVAGIAEHISTFLIYREGRNPVGVAGVELHGDACVLRSLITAPEVRGRGLGRVLVAGALDLARSRGVHVVYLLTTTADRFFASLGFRRCTRAEVPGAVASSVEFSDPTVCPVSAVCMRLELTA